MKVKINISKITDSPYSIKFADSFLFEDNDAIEQLVLALKHGQPSSYLISGYRGAGKTSLVNKIIESLKEEALFVNLSLAKYDGYPVLLKKLIRQLYLGFSKTESLSKEKTDSTGLAEKFSLLYERTFNEITETNKFELKKDKKRTHEIKFDFQKSIPIFFLFFAGTNLAFNALISPYINYVIFIASVIWAVLSSWNLTWTHSRNDTETDELLRKTLYDNEIAEHHLLQILYELKELNKNVVVVFDELDKINSLEEVEKIIHELKSLLLSGLANFIVISGQGLYYQLEKSQLTDDPVISSLFSKTVHVPFLHYSTLKKYCLNLVENEEQKKEPLLNNYFDTLILKSGRVPRKLSNIIRNKIQWEKESAFLIIEEENKKFYENESTLVNIINKIIDGDLPKITDDKVLIDFFIAQIHLWLHKIKVYKGLPKKFTVTEIVEIEQYNQQAYPKSYINQIPSLCELLFDRLVEQNILKKVTNEANEVIEYMWSENKTGTDNGTNESLEIKEKPAKFLSQYIELEKFLRDAFIAEVGEESLKNSNLALGQMLHELTKLGVFSEKRIDSNKLTSFINLRNKVAHGASIDENEIKLLQKSQFDLGIFLAEVIEDYTFYVSKNFLENYKVYKDDKWGFDFVANTSAESVVFEVKYLQSERQSSREVNEIIDKFNNYKQVISLDSYCVLFFYQPSGKKGFDTFSKRFYDSVKKVSPNISNKFFLFYISDSRELSYSEKIRGSLKEVIVNFREM